MGTVADIVTFSLQEGAIYALVALGIVLVYKTSNVLNFAHGGVGAMGAFTGYMVLTGFDLQGSASAAPGRYIVALLTALVVSAALGVLISLLLRRLASSAPVTTLVATVGVALLFISIQVILFGVSPRGFPRPMSGQVCLEQGAERCARPLTLPFGSVGMQWHTVVMLLTLAVVSVLLVALFRTPRGVALLAVAQDPFAARLQGISVAGMTSMAWGIAGALGGLAGMLGAGIFNSIHPAYMLTQFLIFGFVAAVLGGLNSLPGAVAGGLLLGLVASAANQLAQMSPISVPGPPQIAVLLTLIVVLLARPAGLLGKAA